MKMNNFSFWRIHAATNYEKIITAQPRISHWKNSSTTTPSFCTFSICSSVTGYENISKKCQTLFDLHNEINTSGVPNEVRCSRCEPISMKFKRIPRKDTTNFQSQWIHSLISYWRQFHDPVREFPGILGNLWSWNPATEYHRLFDEK